MSCEITQKRGKMKYKESLTSPLGYMRAITSDSGICRLVWQQHPFTDADNSNSVSRETISQLNAYLSGTLTRFTIPFDFSFISPALAGWLEVMQTIGYGELCSYADFAERWGNRNAARAAGGACQRNPIPIIIPCHRVVKSDGSYDNYSGGADTHPRDPENVRRKQWLIEMEAHNSR